MEGTNCDGEGGWTRIVRLNMTEPNASCLAGLMKMNYDNIDHDVCGNSEFSDNYFDCQSLFYGMGINYTVEYVVKSEDTLCNPHHMVF